MRNFARGRVLSYLELSRKDGIVWLDIDPTKDGRDNNKKTYFEFTMELASHKSLIKDFYLSSMGKIKINKEFRLDMLEDMLSKFINLDVDFSPDRKRDEVVMLDACSKVIDWVIDWVIDTDRL